MWVELLSGVVRGGGFVFVGVVGVGVLCAALLCGIVSWAAVR